MKLAIMQPYLFPYLGYFQLIAAVDKFVVYDDVAFMKGGWVNRNQVLLHGRPHLFSVPLQNASCHHSIRDTAVSTAQYPRWKDKFLKSIALAYSRAPQYAPINGLLATVMEGIPASIGELARQSIMTVCDLLELPARIEPTSSIYSNAQLRAQDRVLDICNREGAELYVNAPGGRALYSHDPFAARGIELRFLRSRLPAYPQFNHPFVPALSILDVLMFNEPSAVRRLLAEHDLDQ